jgi:hypothetical protein
MLFWKSMILFSLFANAIFTHKTSFLQKKYCKIPNKIVNLENLTKTKIENRENHEKNIITLSPGGYKGFYMLGVANYIKNNYHLSNCVFSGASAGAWNALFMTFTKNTTTFVNKLLEMENILFRPNITILQVENAMKELLLNISSTQDYELDKLYIGATIFSNYTWKPHIFSNFVNLEDAIDCCIASSHIPFFTGEITRKYRNHFVIDGGFSTYPFLNTKSPLIQISPNMWKNNNTKIQDLEDITTLFSKDKFTLRGLYYDGYTETAKNKRFLDKLFRNKNT